MWDQIVSRLNAGLFDKYYLESATHQPTEDVTHVTTMPMVFWAERFEKVIHYSNQSLNMIILSEYMMNTCDNTITENIAHRI